MLKGTSGRDVYVFCDAVAAVEAADNGKTWIYTVGGTKLEVTETAELVATRMGFALE
jgi:hypothetical protein